MKAKVIETGEIIEVQSLYPTIYSRLDGNHKIIEEYDADELEFLYNETPETPMNINNLTTNKRLLLSDLAARTPYGIICDVRGRQKKLVSVSPFKTHCLEFENGDYMSTTEELKDVKPYLRPLESMTHDERCDLESLCGVYTEGYYNNDENKLIEFPIWGIKIAELLNGKVSFNFKYTLLVNWFNEHHFDYLGLIKAGLAIAAVGENNPYDIEKWNETNYYCN